MKPNLLSNIADPEPTFRILGLNSDAWSQSQTKFLYIIFNGFDSISDHRHRPDPAPGLCLCLHESSDGCRQGAQKPQQVQAAGQTGEHSIVCHILR